MRMTAVQQADVDEIYANLRDRAVASAMRRSVALLNTMVNGDATTGTRTVRAGASAMASPPLLAEEQKTEIDKSMDRLEQAAGELEGGVATLKQEREAAKAKAQQEQAKTQQGVERSTQQPPDKTVNKAATQEAKTGKEPSTPKGKGEQTTTQGTANTPDARRTEQNQSSSPTAQQPVASQEELQKGEEPLTGAALSDEPGAQAINLDDVTKIIQVIVGIWRRWRGQ